MGHRKGKPPTMLFQCTNTNCLMKSRVVYKCEGCKKTICDMCEPEKVYGMGKAPDSEPKGMQLRRNHQDAAWIGSGNDKNSPIRFKDEISPEHRRKAFKLCLKGNKKGTCDVDLKDHPGLFQKPQDFHTKRSASEPKDFEKVGKS